MGKFLVLLPFVGEEILCASSYETAISGGSAGE